MDIIGFPDFQIFFDGSVYNKKTDNFLKSNINHHTGYLQINLTNEYGQSVFKIHRLLATYYLEPIPGKDCVDHIDTNKLNNNLENLRWCNNSENNLNRTFQKNNKLNIKGVYETKYGYEAAISYQGETFTKKFSPKTEESLNLAKEWRNKMSLELCGEFHRE